MMWMMVICCALPIAILFFGGAALFSGGYLGFILVGILALICIGMMFRGHGHSSLNNEHHDTTDVAHADEKKDHSNHSCCH